MRLRAASMRAPPVAPRRGGPDMPFRVGQLVVCVDAFKIEPGRGYGHEVTPEKGRVYTIRTVEPHSLAPSGYLVRLREVVNEPELYAEGFSEFRFAASHFRPVDDSALNIFREALRKAPTRSGQQVRTAGRSAVSNAPAVPGDVTGERLPSLKSVVS